MKTKTQPLTIAQRAEITKISKEFASGFDWEIEGSGWLIVDPLSAFLSVRGFENKLSEMPKSDKHEQVLILTFKDSSQFIPAGADLNTSIMFWNFYITVSKSRGRWVMKKMLTLFKQTFPKRDIWKDEEAHV